MATQKEKNIELEGKIKLVDQKLDLVINNHLAHMQKDIDKIDLRLWAILFMIVALAITNVLATWLS